MRCKIMRNKRRQTSNCVKGRKEKRRKINACLKGSFSQVTFFWIGLNESSICHNNRNSCVTLIATFRKTVGRESRLVCQRINEKCRCLSCEYCVNQSL